MTCEKLAGLGGGRKAETTAERVSEKLSYMQSHVLTVEQGQGPARLWLCKDPNSSDAWFRVVAAPNTLCIYGDIAGRIVYHPCEPDIVPWVRGSVCSPGYFISKMPGIKRAFDPDSVEGVLVEILQDRRENRDFVRARLCIERIRECREWREIHSAEQAFEAIKDLDERAWERGGSFERPTEDVIWFVAAAQKFIELLDGEGA